MIRIASAVAALVILAGASYSYSARTMAQTNDEILPGCDIPRIYGRLVSIMPGPQGGGVGVTTQAVFEAEDGTIRWVAMMQSQTANTTMQPASRGSNIRPAFLPSYQCGLSTEWKRH